MARVSWAQYSLDQAFPGAAQTPAAAPARSVSNLPQATAQLGLTPQEQSLYQHHLDNLWGGGRVLQPGGAVSTMLQAVVTGPDGNYYNIPTVWDGKALSVGQARQRAAEAGWSRWPSYSTPEEADNRYERMHSYMEQDTAAWLQQNPDASVTQSKKGLSE